MTKRWHYTALLIGFGLLLCLLVAIDHYSVLSPSMVVEPQLVEFGDVSATDDVRREITVSPSSTTGGMKRLKFQSLWSKIFTTSPSKIIF